VILITEKSRLARGLFCDLGICEGYLLEYERISTLIEKAKALANMTG
jgi:hypothetical protein